MLTHHSEPPLFEASFDYEKPVLGSHSHTFFECTMQLNRSLNACGHCELVPFDQKRMYQNQRRKVTIDYEEILPIL
jgi:hypothetical protein